MAAESDPLGKGDFETIKRPAAPHMSEEELLRLRSQSSSRLFHSKSFRRLWSAQVISSLGDWIGLVAIMAVARRLGGTTQGSAVALVLTARILPGFFLGPMMGVFIDRVNRKRVMTICDVIRALMIFSLVWVDTLFALVVVQLVIELATLAWGSAKEASVPQLVSKEYLPTANSLAMLASYGTFPIGTGIYALLAVAATYGKAHFPSVELSHSQQNLALLVDSFTYVFSAILVTGLPLVKPERRKNESDEETSRVRETWKEFKDGIRIVGSLPRVRAVIVGMATGIIGGGMIVPLGSFFSEQVLRAQGDAGFSALQSALGFGMALGVIGITFLQKRLDHERAFIASVFGAGIAIFLASASWTLWGAALFIGLLGLFSGGVYVLGYTIMQSDVQDEYRGRIFAAFYTLMRVCLLLALTVAPFMSDILDRLSEKFTDGYFLINDHLVRLPGVRLTLWLGSFIIICAGMLALFTLRKANGSGTSKTVSEGAT